MKVNKSLLLISALIASTIVQPINFVHAGHAPLDELKIANQMEAPVEPQEPVQEKFLDIKLVKSESGVEAWLVEDHSLPIISMDIGFIGAGSINESLEKQGLARLASNTMDEGAGEYDSKSFQKLLSDKSISFRFSSGRDNFQASLKTLTKNKDLAFELLDVALNQPRFDEEPVERRKQANLSRIRSSIANPDWIASRILNDRIYGNDPYAQNSGGTLTTLQALTTEDLKSFVENQISRRGLKISVVGDITASELKERMDKIFGDMNAGLPKSPLPMVELDLGTNYIHEMDIPQSVITIVGEGIDRFDPDYQAAKVMNFILGGGGFGSRLMEEAREKRGLTYGIYSSLSNLDRANLFTVSTSTKNASVQEMLDIIKSEIQKMQEEGVTEAELANAKSYLIGSLPLSLTSTDKISGLMLSLQLSGREQDYLEVREKEIEALTSEDIQRAARRILSGNFSTFIVGNPSHLKNEYIHVVDIPNAE